MTERPITHLMTVMIQEQDLDLVLRSLNELGAKATHLVSTGGFLGRRNVTLLIGLPNDLRPAVVDVLKRSCRQRVEYLAIPLEGSPLPLPTPVPVTVGGATVFTLAVERFEEI